MDAKSLRSCYLGEEVCCPNPTHASPVPMGYPQEGEFLGVVGVHVITRRVWGGRARGFLWDMSFSNLSTPQG